MGVAKKNPGRKGHARHIVRESPGVQFQTISATVPKEIVMGVKAKTGKRGFSRFVASAMARELTQRYRDEFVAAAEREHGPVDEKRLKEILALLDA
jgi:hypothetical protein